VTKKFTQTGLGRLVLIAAAAVALGTGAAQAAQTLGPVTDDIGVIRVPKGAPIQIGGAWVLSGPDTALGLDQKRAVEIAIKDAGGKLLGHPVKFSVEDSLCTAEGGQTAATKLASNPQIVVVLGPACSSATTPAAPIKKEIGKKEYKNRKKEYKKIVSKVKYEKIR